jgi:hypothetical protein
MINLLKIPRGMSRNVGCWNQRPVYTKEELYDFINIHYGLNNLGISICAYEDNLPFLMFLPFDFDKTEKQSLRDVLVEAVKLFNFTVYCGYNSALCYSGRRGYHVYIETEPKLYSKRQVSFTQKLLKKIVGLTMLDEQLFGDIRRLMRIIYTPHPKGALCVPIAYNDGKKLDLDDLFDVDRDELYNEYSTCGVLTDEHHPYPCIEQLIKDREYWIEHHPRHTFEPAHKPIRFSWVALRLDKGKSELEILEEARSFGWDDWDESKTAYQIQHISSRGYLPYSCKSLKKMGYCIIKNCKYNYDIDKDLKELGIL